MKQFQQLQGDGGGGGGGQMSEQNKSWSQKKWQMWKNLNSSLLRKVGSETAFEWRKGCIVWE